MNPEPVPAQRSRSRRCKTNSAAKEKRRRILIKVKDGYTVDTAAANLQAKFPDNQIILTSELEELYMQSIPALNVFLNVVIGVAGVISGADNFAYDVHDRHRTHPTDRRAQIARNVEDQYRMDDRAGITVDQPRRNSVWPDIDLHSQPRFDQMEHTQCSDRTAGCR